MNFPDVFNLLEGLYKAAELDPMSFMVVYPMTLLTSSMLVYALLQDLLPTYKSKVAYALAHRAPKLKTAGTRERVRQSGKRAQFLNR